MSDDAGPSVKMALHVRLKAKAGKESQVEAFLRAGLAAVMEENDTSTWYAVRFGDGDWRSSTPSRATRGGSPTWPARLGMR